jgi:proteasome accessory factor A
VTRQVFCGAGKVGAENQTRTTDYQISQRADFFECLVDLNTMVKRPIINTRDEPHADPAKYRRLHVIVGDANMAELSTYLKVGTLAIVLEMLEGGVEFPRLELDDPVRAIKEVSRDLDMKGSLKLADGRTTSAIGIQRAYLKAALDYFACHELSQVTKDVLVRWEEVLDKLERDPMQLGRELDWVAKRQMIQSYMDRKGCGWTDPRVLLLDLQYHDVRPEKGLYYTLERGNLIDRLVQDSEIVKAEQSPPTGTRAYFRGCCLKKFPRQVYAASWTSVLFDVGNTTIKKIPLMEPLRGTESLTRELLDGSDSAESLLAKLTG